MSRRGGVALALGLLGWGRLGGGPAPVPVWGEAVRCLGIHPLRTRRGRVVCMERYGHSISWAQSHISTRTRMWGHADKRARSWRCARTVHAASLRQRISPSRSP